VIVGSRVSYALARRAAAAALSAEEPLTENDYKVPIAALVRRSILRAAGVSEEPA